MKNRLFRSLLILALSVMVIFGVLGVVGLAADGNDETAPQPENAIAYRLSFEKLQLEWDAISGVDGYRIYADGAPVLETELTVAVVDAGAQYTVSAVFGETEGIVASFATGSGTFVRKDALLENYLFVKQELGGSTFYDKSISLDDDLSVIRTVLDDRGATEAEVADALALAVNAKNTVLYETRNLAGSSSSVSITPDPYNDTDYLHEFMYDGKLNTRFAAYRYSKTESVIVAEFDLGGIYSVSQIDIYEFANDYIPRSETTKIEFFADGKWMDVLPETDTSTLGTGTAKYTYLSQITTPSALQTSKVRVTVSRLVDGSAKNLSIWELCIWGKSFDINGGIGNPVINPEKPTATNFMLADDFTAGSATYTDRVSSGNYMSAAHIGSALQGLKQIRLPIMDSSRSTDTELLNFLKGDNVYLTFEAESDGTVYVVFPSALVNYTEDKGWRQVANGKRLTLPEDESLTTLDPGYTDPQAPYYLTRIQSSNGTPGNGVAFTYCYALDFKRGDTVSIPTPAISGGLNSENLVVLVDCEPITPYLSAISANGAQFVPNDEDTVFVRVPEGTTDVSLDFILLSKQWRVKAQPSNTVTLTSDYETADVTVTDGMTERTYRIVIIREKASLIQGVEGTFEGAHAYKYFEGNDIQTNVNKLTDGAADTYLRVWPSVPLEGDLIFRYNLDGYRSLDTFSIVTNVSNGNALLGDIVIEGLYDGEWFYITTLDVPTVGTVSTNVISATVTVDDAVTVNAIRFRCGYNSAVLSSDGTSIGSALLIYELDASLESDLVVPDPEIISITVNGKRATVQNGKYYVAADKTATKLEISAVASHISSVITYSPASSVGFAGKKKILTLSVTNLLGESKEYTLIVDASEPTKNVLLGTTPTFTGASSVNSSYPLSNINDGNKETRVACSLWSAYEIEFVLDGTYDLFGMDFYGYVHGGNAITGIVTVRALIGDHWVDVAVCDSAKNFTVHEGKSGIGRTTCNFDVKGARAVRVHVEQNPTMLNNGPSIWEIDIHGAQSKSAHTNILQGVTPSFVTAATLHDGYPLSHLTDGNIATRLAARSIAPYEIELALDSKYDLSTFVLYTYTHTGIANTGTVTVRGLVGDEWYDLAVLDMRSDFITTVNNTAYKIVYLGTRDVSAIRIHVTHNEELGKGASIWEVIAYGSESEEADSEQSLFDGYGIFSSVTIHNGFDINVFLPVTDGMQVLQFAGKNYDLSSLTPVEIGGSSYYKLTLAVDAKDGYYPYALSLTLSSEDKQETKSWSISLCRYLATLMASSAKDTEKAIALNVLAYIRAAIVYFNPDMTDADADYEEYLQALDALDALLAHYCYTEVIPESLKAPTTAPITGTGIARAAFSLDANVSFVLEPEEGYDLSDFTFRVGGAPATVSLIDGYIYVTVYAYRIKDTLTWTVADRDDASIIHTGELSLATYYASETVQNSDALSTLIERLAAFSESAAAYIDQLPVSLTVRYESEDGRLLASETLSRSKGSSYCIYTPSFEGYYTTDFCMRGTMDTNKTVTVTYKEIPKNADPTVIASLIPGITCWGDSITAGAGNGNVTAANTYGIDLVALGSTAVGANYPNVLANLIERRVCGGVSIANCGVGGESSAVIAARAMTETYYLYIGEEVTVEPKGSAVIDIQQYSTTGRLGILRQGKTHLINEVTINGKDSLGNAVSIKGNITLELREGATNIYTCPYSDLVYTFTRTDNGTTDVTLEVGAKIVTYCSYAYDGNWCVIFMGQNGGYSDFDELIRQQREILEACECSTNYIIIGLSSGTASDRASMEDALREYWGDHYFSAREYLSSAQTLELAGFGAEEIASVRSAIESGKVSSLLLHDNTHLNAVGYAMLANAVFERMADLGYFDPIFEYYESLQ